MNKQPIIDSLNKKIKRIDSKYETVDENDNLVLRASFSGFEFCRFKNWKKDGFVCETWAFGPIISELVVRGESDNTLLKVAQIFHKEGFRLLGGLDNA